MLLELSNPSNPIRRRNILLPSLCPRVVVAKTDATSPAMTADTSNRSLLPEAPVQPDKGATEPNSTQAATDPIPPSATPGEAARQSFNRVVNTFGGLFGARTPPAGQSDPVSSSAGWAVQLAAPKSETEAKSDLRQLNAKYASALKGSKIGVHKATVDGETVYRLRVVDLSKADASALCARLQGRRRQLLRGPMIRGARLSKR